MSVNTFFERREYLFVRVPIYISISGRSCLELPHQYGRIKMTSDKFSGTLLDFTKGTTVIHAKLDAI